MKRPTEAMWSHEKQEWFLYDCDDITVWFQNLDRAEFEALYYFGVYCDWLETENKRLETELKRLREEI